MNWSRTSFATRTAPRRSSTRSLRVPSRWSSSAPRSNSSAPRSAGRSARSATRSNARPDKPRENRQRAGGAAAGSPALIGAPLPCASPAQALFRADERISATAAALKRPRIDLAERAGSHSRVPRRQAFRVRDAALWRTSAASKAKSSSVTDGILPATPKCWASRLPTERAIHHGQGGRSRDYAAGMRPERSPGEAQDEPMRRI